jgi:hypothetical protein
MEEAMSRFTGGCKGSGRQAARSFVHGFGNTNCMLQSPTKRKEVKYWIVDESLTENLDPVFFMISSSLELKDEFEVVLLQFEHLCSGLA